MEKKNVVDVFRWQETQINRKTHWMTSTRKKWRTRCVTHFYFTYGKTCIKYQEHTAFMKFFCLLVGVLKAQEDIAGGQKREVEEEDPYNEENIEQVGSLQTSLLFPEGICTSSVSNLLMMSRMS